MGATKSRPSHPGRGPQGEQESRGGHGLQGQPSTRLLRVKFWASGARRAKCSCSITEYWGIYSQAWYS